MGREDPEGMVGFCAQEEDGDLFVTGTGICTIGTQWLSGRFLDKRPVDIVVVFDTECDEDCVKDANGQENDGWCQSIKSGKKEKEERL